MIKALPRFVHKGRTYILDERLNEVRSYEYGKKPIVYRGAKAKSFLKKAKPIGWRNESARHSLARKGIKTGKTGRKKNLTKSKWRKEFGYSQDVSKLEKERNLRKVEEQRMEDEEKSKRTMADIKSDLAGFTGTQQYHKGWAGVKWTDGVAHFFEKHGGWLITDISSYWVDPRARKEEFQVWTLTVNPDKTGILKMTDGNSEKAIKTQKYNYLDLPAGKIKFYLAHQPDEQGKVFGVLMLPSEY